MPKISVEMLHALGRDEVVARLKRESDVLRGSFGHQVENLEESWEGHELRFRFQAFGMSFDGSLAVEPDRIDAAVNVPLTAMMFKSAIEEKIRARLSELLKP